MGRKAINLIGQRFGNLTVESRDESSNRRRAVWFCRCDCGRHRLIDGSDLRSGKRVSCGTAGCKRSGNPGRPQKSNDYHRTRKSWKSMVDRCINPKNISFHRYGGKGIKVCPRWLNSFYAFVSDLGYRPDGTSIDRIDGNGNYEPSNCRWATRKEQARNHSNAAKVTHKDRSFSYAEWSEITGIPARTIRYRIKEAGMSPEQALKSQ